MKMASLVPGAESLEDLTALSAVNYCVFTFTLLRERDINFPGLAVGTATLMSTQGCCMNLNWVC